MGKPEKRGGRGGVLSFNRGTGQMGRLRSGPNPKALDGRWWTVLSNACLDKENNTSGFSSSLREPYTLVYVRL